MAYYYSPCVLKAVQYTGDIEELEKLAGDRIDVYGDTPQIFDEVVHRWRTINPMDYVVQRDCHDFTVVDETTFQALFTELVI